MRINAKNSDINKIAKPSCTNKSVSFGGRDAKFKINLLQQLPALRSQPAVRRKAVHPQCHKALSSPDKEQPAAAIPDS